MATNPSPGNIDWLIDIRQVFGLAYFEKNLNIANSTLEKTILSVVVALLLGLIIYGYFKVNYQAKIVVLCFILPHLGSVIWFYNKPRAHYLYFKGWSIGLFIYVILLAVGLFAVFKKSKTKASFTKLSYISFAFFILLLIRSSVNQIIHVEQNLAVTPDIVDVGLWIEDTPVNEKIYIASGDTSVVSTFWMAYFLIDHPIRYSTRMVYTSYPTTLYQQEPWILREKQSSPFWDETLWQEVIFEENDTFILSTLEWKNKDYTIPEVQYPLDVNVENQFHLLGYDLEIDPEQIETILNLTLFWQVTQQTDQNYKLFIHLLDQEGNLVQQLDTYPYNSVYHTSYWQAEEIISDSYTLTLDGDFLPGSYTLKTGWYLEQTGERLEVEQNGVIIEDSSILLIDSVEIEE